MFITTLLEVAATHAHQQSEVTGEQKTRRRKKNLHFFLNSSYSSFFPKKTTAVLPYGKAPTQHGTNAVVRQCAALVSGRSIQIICRSARHEILFLRLKKKNTTEMSLGRAFKYSICNVCLTCRPLNVEPVRERAGERERGREKRETLIVCAYCFS